MLKVPAALSFSCWAGWSNFNASSFFLPDFQMFMPQSAAPYTALADGLSALMTPLASLIGHYPLSSPEQEQQDLHLKRIYDTTTQGKMQAKLQFSFSE